MRWQSPLTSLLAAILFAVGCATASASFAATRPAEPKLRLPPAAGVPELRPIVNAGDFAAINAARRLAREALTEIAAAKGRP